MRWQRLLGVLWLVLAVAVPAFAVNPSETLSDPALEARARAISRDLRCLVCQNENIDDSNADLAHDLRVLVRERITAGDTDQQVKDYLVARYGEFVLLRPVVAWHTILLWIAGPLILIGGAIGLGIGARRRKFADTPTELDESEREALARLTDSDQ